jgi:dTDP-4-amino-4,6-dideoxygalactose transaminase
MTAPIPVNSLERHIEPLRGALQAAAAEVIGSGYFVLGPSVAAFEREFSAYCGTSHCIGVANGTDALEICLKALGVAAGDRVAVVANAAMYGTSAVLACAATPVFVDVEPTRGTMDPQQLERLLATDAGIKAVIVTHLYGHLCRMDDIVRACRTHGVALVEDCAQAHGAQLPSGARAGSIGDIASFSFYPTKNLGALGDGGAVVTNRADLADRSRRLRQYGWSEKYTNGLPGGRNSRLDEIQARMLSAMLPLLDQWNTRRRDIANRYSREIDHPEVKVPPVGGDDYVAHLFVVQSERRDALKTHLAGLGIQTDVHYPRPDHRQPCHGGRYDGLSLPVTESLATTVLTLPCFPELSDDEVSTVIAACNSF